MGAALNTDTTTASLIDEAMQLLTSQGFVQYYPNLAETLGNFKAALFLGHALYWARHTAVHYKNRDGWFFLTAKQCTQATGLSTREQESARLLLVQHSLIQEKLAGRPAKLHYRINLDRLASCLGISVVDQKASWAQLAPLLKRYVSFYRPLADIAGNVASGLYLSYLLIQQRHVLTYSRSIEGEFTLSQQAIRNALCLTSKTQRNARDRLKQMGLLQEAGNRIRINLLALCPLLHGQEQFPLKSESTDQPPIADAPKLTSVSKPVPVNGQKPAPSRSSKLFGAGTQSQRPLFDLDSAGAARANATVQHALRDPASMNPGRLFAQTSVSPGAACGQLTKTSDLTTGPVAQNAKLAAQTAKLTCPKRETKLPKPRNNNTTISLQTTTRPAITTASAGDKSKALVEIAGCRRDDLNVQNDEVDISLPSVLGKQWHEAVRKVLATAKPEHRQCLLDELEGQLRNPGKQIANPPGYLHSLRVGLESGRVQLAYAQSIASQREQNRHAQDAVQEHIKALNTNLTTTLPPMTKEEAFAQLRQQVQTMRKLP